MNKRVYFRSKKARDSFFEFVLRRYNFLQWSELARFLHIRRTLLEKYRQGNLTLPFNLYTRLSLKLGKEDKSIFSNSITLIESNWGQRKGGDITYRQHREIFDLGRLKGIAKRRQLSHKFGTDLPLSPLLAYFIGLFIGDGFTNKYGRYYLTQFVGEKSNEYEYYNSYISDIVKQLFGLRIIIREPKIGNYIRINLYSKDLYSLITHRFGINAGMKSRTVTIPNEIVNSNSKITLSCIAGIFDAEACVFFDKRNNYLNPYPRIDLHMENVIIMNQIHSILNSYSIHHTIHTKNNHILIYGKENILNFLKYVPLRNPKHLSKLALL